MLRGPFSLFTVLVALAGCPGGGGSLGDTCGGNGDCESSLQCLNSRCVARCVRAPECGDGFSCDKDGLCRPATGVAGDQCKSEGDCAAGLACRIDGTTIDGDSLRATCAQQLTARPAGAECSDDSDCRNRTCALGRCVDLCRETRDCGAGTSCKLIPRVQANGEPFSGCLPSEGVLSWSIPVSSPSEEILLPVPEGARAAQLVMRIDEADQRVGALSVKSPKVANLYDPLCFPQPLSTDPGCDPTSVFDAYYANPLRHLPDFGQSVLVIPPDEIGDQGGAYRVQVSSFLPNWAPGAATPRVNAVVQLGAGLTLDVHFFFLNLDEHPCSAGTANTTLRASSAKDADYFQKVYLEELKAVFAHAGLKLGTITYEDIRSQPELDGLDIERVGDLLELGTYSTGINVFFVRTLSPVGLQAFGPNPGPAGLGGTRQSGIVIGLDTLCYRDWSTMARLTAHEMARYMGLYHNVEIETAQRDSWRDPIEDSDDSSQNLMFFSELGGSELSAGQRKILSRSPVLR